MKVGVLASGEGSNLQAILDDGIAVAAVASDNPAARALARARRAAVPARAFPIAEFDSRAARDAAIGDWLAAAGVELVVLAGYMRLLDPAFLDRFPRGVINVHPSLLPAFAGIDAIGQALTYGVRVVGVTVHFVDDGIDTGPIIFQRAIDLPPAADAERVRAALRPIEHELLPSAIRALAAGTVQAPERRAGYDAI